MQIIDLIKDSAEGKKQSQGVLFECVYDDLRTLARKIRFDWRSEHTLNTTALVHEAYLKVCNSHELSFTYSDVNEYEAAVSYARMSLERQGWYDSARPLVQRANVFMGRSD